MSPIKNSRGQGLIEYLILVALMAVATIGVVRSLGHVVKSRFGNAIYALEGKNKKVRADDFDESEIKKNDLGDFMNNAAKGNGK
jgi:pilus assembly protein Flp/PilA